MNSVAYFVLGMLFSYIAGIIVSYINILTERALKIRLERKKMERDK